MASSSIKGHGKPLGSSHTTGPGNGGDNRKALKRGPAVRAAVE